MAIADKLLELNNVKQDIKTAIEMKGIPMTNVAFTEYANKIADISGGGGEVDEYFYYSKAYYTITNNATLFENAWQDMKDSETVLFDIPLSLAASNQDMGGMIVDLYVGTNEQLEALYDYCVNKEMKTVLFDIPLSLAASNQDMMEGANVDLYVGTNGQLQALYDACVNGTLPQPIYVNNVETPYAGDVSGMFGFPAPLYMFGEEMGNIFMIGDLTWLREGLSLALAKIANVSIPNNNIVIEQKSETPRDVYYVNNVATPYVGEVSGDVGFSIPLYNFGELESNDNTSFLIGDLTPLGTGLGLVLAKIANVSIPNNNIVIQQGFEFENENGIIIPERVTTINESTFYGWESNNQPLVIPDNVTSIGTNAFNSWKSNNQQLVIPNSVTSIGWDAFSNWTSNNRPLTIQNGVTDIGEYTFQNWTSNNQPLVIPDSVTSIGNFAFYEWRTNNQPLVIGNGVTSIGSNAFSEWRTNNKPLVIPNSVTSIGISAFQNWTSNDQPLVIPNSVTSISYWAFSGWLLVPYIIIEREVPPTIESNSFYSQKDTPIYVPHDSVNDYKTATNWTTYASRIFSINDKP